MRERFATLISSEVIELIKDVFGAKELNKFFSYVKKIKITKRLKLKTRYDQIKYINIYIWKHHH